MAISTFSASYTRRRIFFSSNCTPVGPAAWCSTPIDPLTHGWRLRHFLPSAHVQAGVIYISWMMQSIGSRRCLASKIAPFVELSCETSKGATASRLA